MSGQKISGSATPILFLFFEPKRRFDQWSIFTYFIGNMTKPVPEGEGGEIKMCVQKMVKIASFMFFCTCKFTSAYIEEENDDWGISFSNAVTVENKFKIVQGFESNLRGIRPSFWPPLKNSKLERTENMG